jgi:2-polyprenyl-3-methyl-5-hydroxy-6-metoxy-1,4-benzoquinol methylase
VVKLGVKADKKMPNLPQSKSLIKIVIGAYDDFIVSLYCNIRFIIMNVRMLEEIEQYLPKKGTIIDAGCGFGLFALYFAKCAVERKIIGYDINAKRISIAKKACHLLQLSNQIDFKVQDMARVNLEQPIDAVYMLDLLHHLHPRDGEKLLHHFHQLLSDHGVLIIKDVTSRPWWKMAFTYLLDLLMDPKARPRYYARDELISLLERHGFEVKFHHMPDILPYPHILYISKKTTARGKNELGSAPNNGS